MRKKPLVSILIASYNKEKYVQRCINSCLNQTYNNIEVIFYDDGSKDNSYEIAKKIKGIKVFKNKKRKNLGKFNTYYQINSYNKAFLKSKGKYILLLDSDDFFKKNKVKEIVNFFYKNPKKEILFDKPIIFKNKNDKNLSSANYFSRENKWPKFPPTSCISVRKKSLKKAMKKIFVKKFHDLWFDFRLSTYFAINKNQFNLLKTNLTFYRNYQDSYDKRFKKYLNLQWWNRRSQAFDFILFLNSKKFKKNKYSFDFLLTKLIDKLNFIF